MRNLVLVSIILFIPTFVSAAVRYASPGGTDAGTCVNANAPCKTIVYTVAQAAKGDRIQLAAGTYNESGIGGKSVTISGLGPASTVIDARGQGTVISHTLPGSTLLVEKIRITGGQSATDGGGIYVGADATVIVRGALINNNHADRGGGIAVTGGTLRLLDSTVSANTADTQAGGILSTDSFFVRMRFRNVVTIQNSLISENVSRFGGGIHTLGGTLTVDQSSVNYNRAEWGGALYGSGHITFTHSRVNWNRARWDGGGLRLLDIPVVGLGCSDVRIDNSEIASNRSDQYGGGIAAYTALSVNDSRIVDNFSKAGGGGVDYAPNSATGAECPFILSRTEVSGNSTEAFGGGVFAAGGDADHAMYITDSTISKNEASYEGGGLSVLGAYTFIRNTLISDNAAPSYGGISLWGGTAPAVPVPEFHLDQSTVSGNTGGIAAIGIDVTSDVFIHNSTIVDNETQTPGSSPVTVLTNFGTPAHSSIQGTIIADNFLSTPTGKQHIAQCSGPPLTSTGYNLVGDETCQFSAPGDIHGTLLNPLSAQLGQLSQHGGPTATHEPLAQSPVIDAGNPAGCVDTFGTPESEDQRGFLRPRDGDGNDVAVCDIGAFEVQ